MQLSRNHPTLGLHTHMHSAALLSGPLLPRHLWSQFTFLRPERPGNRLHVRSHASGKKHPAHHLLLLTWPAGSLPPNSQTRFSPALRLGMSGPSFSTCTGGRVMGTLTGGPSCQCREEPSASLTFQTEVVCHCEKATPGRAWI